MSSENLQVIQNGVVILTIYFSIAKVKNIENIFEVALELSLFEYVSL